jgi:GcrA cell cycle regulator
MQAMWTSDDIDVLKQLWAQGKTADAIAKQLGGISRSAVLGKIFRLRLARDTAAAPAETSRAQKIDGIARRKTSQTSQRKPAPLAGQNTKPAPRGKSLFELTNACCRWPFRRPGTEKYFFCGVEEADLDQGIPYCARHMKRAYVIPPVPVAAPAASRPPRPVYRAA